MIDMEGSLAAALWGFRLRRSRHNFFCTIGVDQWFKLNGLTIEYAYTGETLVP